MGLGNELFSDDAVGILAVRKIAPMASDRADFVETSLHGVALLDLFIGYRKAIIVDAMKTGRFPPGTVVDIVPEELEPVANPSPHYTGIPELIKLARQLKIEFPEEFKIVAMEVANTCDMGGELSAPVAKALEQLVARVMTHLAK
ncbi:MAG: hydrogenase maturation protease [candidate division Zixibacteria bacterium]|nr:hydrogenase maturation protease [candidate division Zixibacteria bacterium]MDD5426700.1 hydrogenase maturation protease [candidate division Zixibacteria bacterium]